MTHDPGQLTDCLFAGVLEDPPWLAFLEALEDALPSHNATMVMRKPRAGDPGIVISPRGNIRGISVHQERLFKKSPFLELPVNRVCILREMLTAESRKYYAEYFQYLGAFGTSDLIGLDLVDPQSGMTFRLRAGRNIGEPDFGEAEKRLLEALMPRMQLAVAIYGRLVAQRNQLQVHTESSEQLSIGSLMLSETGEILTQNTVVERLLERKDGLYAELGHLCCVNPEDEHTLRGVLQKMVKSEELHGIDRLLKIQRADGRYWNMLLRPAGPGIALGENTARAIIVFIRDASNIPQISGALLGELFGLTPAESAVAIRLVQGQSIEEASAALGVSKYTARAQLASIFSKTNTHRQPQLVSMILNTVNTLWG